MYVLSASVDCWELWHSPCTSKGEYPDSLCAANYSPVGMYFPTEKTARLQPCYKQRFLIVGNPQH